MGGDHATHHLFSSAARYLDMLDGQRSLAFLSFMCFELLLFAGVCFVAFASSVTLLEQLVEWRRHGEASPVQRQLLPPAS